MPDQSKFLHSDYLLGCLFGAIPLGLRRLRLGLCGVANSLGQHLAQFSLGLRRLAWCFLPLGHAPYVGKPRGELNPHGPAGRGCG